MSSTQSADLIQFGGDKDDNAMKIDSGIVVAVEAMESESSTASVTLAPVLGQNEKNLSQVCINELLILNSCFECHL